jgi:XTP/dITP diphosphohydrolase
VTVPELIAATDNPGKLAEIERLLAGTPWRLIAQRAAGVAPAAETGATFRDNALLKARNAAAVARGPALADDSGIEVDALGGAPGVRSARYAGERATDAENVAKLLSDLRGVPHERRTARFRCVIALVRHARDEAPIVCEGVWEGVIAESPRGANGFGYDPVFVPRGARVTSAELAPAAKDAESHRGQALRRLVPALETLLRERERV